MADSSFINPQRLQRLLQRLINIYSPSGKEEEILESLFDYLKGNNLPVLRQDVDDNRYNLVVMPPDTDIQLAFVGHVDTVTAYDLEHYEYIQEGDLVRGLGSADMKSGCSAMVEAFLSAWEHAPTPPPVALALVVGEEEEGDGARELMRDFRFPWAVIGEPTNLVPCLSSYGYLETLLSAKGKRMHASLSNREANPVVALLRSILGITRHLDENRPELVYNIRDLWSSHAGFVVPEFCEVRIDIHLPPSAGVSDMMAELEEIVARTHAENKAIEVALRFDTVDAGFTLPEKGPVVESLKDIYSRRSLMWRPSPFISHSDASQFWQAGVRTMLLGPGRIEKAHAPDESASFKQICLAAEIYYDLAAAMGVRESISR
jgi:acetylornithine deacetylase